MTTGSDSVVAAADPAAASHLAATPLLPALLRQGSLLALGMASHASINLIDLWLVGKLGAAAVAGVHVATVVNFLPMIVGNGVTVASLAAMSRALGAGRGDDARRLSARALSWMFVLGLVIGVIGAGAAAPCVDLQGATGEARAVGIHYLVVANLGTVSMFVLMQASASMRAAGEVWMPLVILLGANALNLVLDVVLLFGWDALGVPALGAPGAAYASVVARTLFAALGVWWLHRPSHPLRVTRLWLRHGPVGEVRNLLLVGLPQSLQMVVRTGVVIALTRVAESLSGQTALTALGVTTRLDTVVLFSAAGFASAGTALVGHAMGAGVTARARHAANLTGVCSFLVGCVAASAIYLLAPYLLAFFVQGADEAVVAMGTSYLGIAVIGHAFGSYALGATAGVNGAGRTVPPMLLDALVYLVVLPPALLLAMRQSEPGSALAPLWWSLTAVNVVLAAAHAVYLWAGRWTASPTVED